MVDPVPNPKAVPPPAAPATPASPASPAKPPPTTVLGWAESVLDALGTSPPRPAFEKHWYRSERVQLDGFVFKQCRFDNAALVSRSGDITLIDCFIGEDCRIVLGDPAKRVFKLMNWRGNLGTDVMPDTKDGLITIVKPPPPPKAAT